VQHVKDIGRRVLEALERRRAAAVRHRPRRLVGRLAGARTILVLCQGNVIRSVFAARLLTAALAGRSPVSVRSAGLETTAGWPAHPYVTARCADLGIDLSSHSSVPVTTSMVETADVVLVMEVFQLAVVWRRFPRARRRTFLVSGLAPDIPLEILDPAGKDEVALRACLDHIARSLTPIIEIMATRGSRRRFP